MAQTQGFQKSIKNLNTRKGRCVAAATMTVTVALEEVRRRGYLHRDDTRHMTHAEYNDYVDLAKRELGVTEWQPEA
jgi:hypothetical protein